MQPRIAIPLPTSVDHAYNLLNWRVYADAVRASGGLPVEAALTSSSAALERIAHEMDGLLLPGSPLDIDPELYGQPREPECGPSDPLREQTDRILLENAYSEGKPILAICFGMQMLNVFCGGTLVQDLMILPVNHAAAKGVHVAYGVNAVSDSRLGKMVTQSAGHNLRECAQVSVNSSHHQAVGIVGKGLRAVARSRLDGVVEAVEAEHVPGEAARHFVLGLQWHPERTFITCPSSRTLFQHFVEAAALVSRIFSP